MMKIPSIEKLHFPTILKKASHFKMSGSLEKSKNNLIYVNIDDCYIHELYPLLKDETILKPDYFGKGKIGAHVTVIYPEEVSKVDLNEIGETYSFTLKEIISAIIGKKQYYVILVESPSLLQLRNKYGFPDYLNFKGYAIGFHITIGVKYI